MDPQKQTRLLSPGTLRCKPENETKEPELSQKPLALLKIYPEIEEPPEWSETAPLYPYPLPLQGPQGPVHGAAGWKAE